jgi:hypothetical protein
VIRVKLASPFERSDLRLPGRGLNLHTITGTRPGAYPRPCVAHCVFVCLFVDPERNCVKHTVSLNFSVKPCVFALSATLRVTVELVMVRRGERHVRCFQVRGRRQTHLSLCPFAPRTPEVAFHGREVYPALAVACALAGRYFRFGRWRSSFRPWLSPESIPAASPAHPRGTPNSPDT